MDNLNLNLNQCLKEISNIGSTTYQNICTGGTQTVPWGTGNWLSLSLLIIVVGVFVWAVREVIKQNS